MTTYALTSFADKQGRRAFTLIELLVVIAIIAILAAILFPVFAKAKQAAKVTASLSNAKQQGLNLLMYNRDYDDNFVIAGQWYSLDADAGQCMSATPYMPWTGLVEPYLKNVQVVLPAIVQIEGLVYTDISSSVQHFNSKCDHFLKQGSHKRSGADRNGLAISATFIFLLGESRDPKASCYKPETSAPDDMWTAIRLIDTASQWALLVCWMRHRNSKKKSSDGNATEESGSCPPSPDEI